MVRENEDNRPNASSGDEASAEDIGGGADDVAQDLAALQKAGAEQAAAVDHLQRALADMDNRRKRVERQLDETRRYAVQSFAVEILGVIDNFERALRHAEDTRDFDTLHDGLKLVHDQLLGVLKQHDVERIDAAGKPFDPNFHEAVGQVDSASHPDQTVIEVAQEGYRMHDRTIRPARVVVSRKPSAPAGDELEDEQE